MLAASIRVTCDEIIAERPRELFRGKFIVQDGRLEWSYDPTTDDLIMIGQGDHEISRDRFVVVTDWPAELADRPAAQ